MEILNRHLQRLRNKMMDSYRFGAGRYIQENGALDQIGAEVLRYGHRPYVIGGNTALEKTRQRIEASFQRENLGYVVEAFSGYPSRQKIEELKQSIQREACDVLIAAGGGRIMDLAKGAAFELEIPIVAVPTQAATCAAFSPLSVLYTPEGKSDDYIQYEYEVNEVIVDEQVMLSQTPRLLAAGILDAMAKYVEIETLHPHVLDEHTSIARHSAFYMAKYTYDVLKEKGPRAVADLKAGNWTKDLNDVVYVNIALTGIISAMMQGRGQTALAHDFNNAMHKNFLEVIKSWLHGEGVAVGMLAQLIYNEEKERVQELHSYMQAFDMPCSLKELGMALSEENVELLYQKLCTYEFMTHDKKHEELLRRAVEEIRE